MPLDRTWCELRGTIVLVVLLAPLAYAQGDAPINGTVISADSQPIAGVSVSGSESKMCCPFKREHAKTDEKGGFYLEHPGAVPHLFHRDYEPQKCRGAAWRSESENQTRISEQRLVAVDCQKLRRTQREIGWGKHRPRFSVSRKGVKISGGKPDVDYVLYLIQSDNSQTQLELWFGANAIGLDPADQQFLNSTTFSQRTYSLPRVNSLEWIPVANLKMDRSGDRLRSWLRWSKVSNLA